MCATIDHEEALQIAQRLINSHFERLPHARVSIPARPDYDDDLLIITYIQQQQAAASEILSDENIDRALRATVPGGAEVWNFLPQKDAHTPHETARSVVRVIAESLAKKGA